jgi:hypothetical protein
MMQWPSFALGVVSCLVATILVYQGKQNKLLYCRMQVYFSWPYIVII